MPGNPTGPRGPGGSGPINLPTGPHHHKPAGHDPGGITLPPPSGGTQSTPWQSFAQYLESLGIGNYGAALAFAKHAASAKWTLGQFQYELYQQKFFKAAFPGLVMKGGGLRMSPQEYLSRWRSTQGIAKQYGITLTKPEFGRVVTNNTPIPELETKFQAIKMVHDNADDFKAFSQTLQDLGFTKKPLTLTEMTKFALGEADSKWYNVWRVGSQSIAAAQAGFQLGTDITSKQLQQIAKYDPNKAMSPGALTQEIAKWQDAAQKWSAGGRQAAGAGVDMSVDDLAEMEFGGPRAGQIYASLQSAQQNVAASDRSVAAAAPNLGAALSQTVGQSPGAGKQPRGEFGQP